MLFWTLQITVISIILIFLVHHLILFFKRTLTVPKVKDLVNAPAQKYESIYNTISSSSNSINPINPINNPINQNPITTQPTHDIQSMKDELKNFLRTKIKEDTSGTSSIASLDAYGGSSNFSSY